MAKSALGFRYPKLKNERLAKALTRALIERGPVPIPIGDSLEYELATKYGPLRVRGIRPSTSGRGVWLYTAFEKPELAKDGGLFYLNEHSGKWNHLFEYVDDVSGSVAAFNRLLDSVEARDPRAERRAGRAGGSSSSRNRLGDRRACGRCGMDIEFQGSRFGWMGRGKDRFCDDSGSGIPNMPHKLHDPNAKPIARRAGRAGGAMTRAELTKLIRSAINPGVARRNIVKVSDTHVDGPLAGNGGAIFVVFSSVPPGSSEIDALNARVSFMLAIEAPEWSQVKTAHHGPNLPAKRVTLRQFKGRTSIRGRSGTPESIARYVADVVNTADVVRRPGRAGGSSDGVRVADRDRKKLLMAIYKSTNVSDKMLRGDKHTIMLVGGSAERFGVSNYTNVVLEDLDNAELYRLAKARGIIKPGRAGGTSIPAEVARVHELMQASAVRSGLPKRAAYLSHEADGSYLLADNFERYSSLLLRFKGGSWTARNMHSERSRTITQKEAEENARLFFSDGKPGRAGGVALVRGKR